MYTIGLLIVSSYLRINSAKGLMILTSTNSLSYLSTLRVRIAQSIEQRASNCTARVRFLAGARIFFLHFTASRPALRPTQSSIQLVLGSLSPGVQPPGREANHSPPYSAKIKNGGVISQLHHTPLCLCLLIKHKLQLLLNYVFNNSTY
jgi:hypothetical protein